MHARLLYRLDGRCMAVEIRAGRRGTGRLLWRCRYIPDSRASVDEMELHLRHALERLHAQGWTVRRDYA